MLSELQILENKEMFLRLVASIERDCDTQGLVDYLLSTDFFTAPASTKYKYSYKGGLCEHALDVYDKLHKLVNEFANHIEYSGDERVLIKPYSEDTLKIVSLFHDISKADFYETYVQNKKQYSSDGDKFDDIGKYKWVSEKAFKVKDTENRMILGGHSFNSYYQLSKYINLDEEETAALLNQRGGWGQEAEMVAETSAIFGKFPLAALLHVADLLSMYIENEQNN